jgi:hypothetical protein
MPPAMTFRRLTQNKKETAKMEHRSHNKSVKRNSLTYEKLDSWQHMQNRQLSRE